MTLVFAEKTQCHPTSSRCPIRHPTSPPTVVVGQPSKVNGGKIEIQRNTFSSERDR